MELFTVDSEGSVVGQCVLSQWTVQLYHGESQSTTSQFYSVEEIQFIWILFRILLKPELSKRKNCSRAIRWALLKGVIILCSFGNSIKNFS